MVDRYHLLVCQVIEMLVSFAISKKSDTAPLRPLIQKVSRCSPQVALGDFQACDAFDAIEKLNAIKVPVLVLTAEDDLLTTVKYGAFLKERIKTAEHVHIAAAGHLSPIEKPDQINGAILDFIQNII